MDPIVILAIVNGLIKAAFSIWASARKVVGKDKIPEWHDILERNKAFQAEIDEEAAIDYDKAVRGLRPGDRGDKWVEKDKVHI